MLENSRVKLEKKNVDMICANNLKVDGAGFGVDTNVITLITRDRVEELPLLSKEAAAAASLTGPSLWRDRREIYPGTGQVPLDIREHLSRSLSPWQIPQIGYCQGLFHVDSVCAMFCSELRLYIREIVVLNLSLLPSVHTLFDFLLATYAQSSVYNRCGCNLCIFSMPLRSR